MCVCLLWVEGVGENLAGTCAYAVHVHVRTLVCPMPSRPMPSFPMPHAENHGTLQCLISSCSTGACLFTLCSISPYEDVLSPFTSSSIPLRNSSTLASLTIALLTLASLTLALLTLALLTPQQDPGQEVLAGRLLDLQPGVEDMQAIARKLLVRVVFNCALTCLWGCAALCCTVFICLCMCLAL